MPFAFRLIPAAAAACLLASCGGGGGRPPGDGDGPTSRSAGVAVDGYLRSASVLCDTDGDGATGTTERAVGTDGTGRFVFEPACESALVLRGGTNVDTGLPFVGVLRAPAGATVVSPLTTLIAAGLSAERLASVLGLPAGTDVTTTDPAAQVDGAYTELALLRRTLAVQQVLQKSAELFSALTGKGSATSVQAFYAKAVEALVAALEDGPALFRNGTVDADVVARIVAAAAADVAAETPFTATVNTAALAEVVAGALAAQARTLLTASGAELVDATRTAQSSTLITNFVLANLAALAGPPDDDTAALADQLQALADPYLALAGDQIRLVDGPTVRSYALGSFATEGGFEVPWPLPEPMTLRVTLADPGDYTPEAGRAVSAAVAITSDDNQATILAYIDGVSIERVGTALRLTVGAGSSAKVYGVAADGRRRAVIDFGSNTAASVGTLPVDGTTATSVPVGNIVNFAIGRLSNSFSGIYALRGTYNVKVVVTGLPVRRADGRLLPATSITVPTSLDRQGQVATSTTVSGRGLAGRITLVD
jgi:hypothetical protein